MKKILFLNALAVTLTLASFGQSYNTSIGLGLDFGEGSTLVGPSVKHFFSENSAIQGQLLFGDGLTNIGVYYQYHGALGEARNLTWYAGGGPAALLAKGASAFALRPMVGLDFKPKDAPIAINFDWRPAMTFAEGGSDFTPARFGISIAYTLK